MKRTQYVSLALAVCFLAGYAAAAPRILQTQVGRMYRAYYIEHKVVEWHTSAYLVPESEGIDFTRNGRPTWIRSMSGLSPADPSGTWTDARRGLGAAIRYRAPFEGQVCVRLLTTPSDANVGGVSYLQMGTESRAFMTPNPTSEWHSFSILLTAPTALVRIYPGATERMSAADPRVIGLALIRLIVTPGVC